MQSRQPRSDILQTGERETNVEAKMTLFVVSGCYDGFHGVQMRQSSPPGNICCIEVGVFSGRNSLFRVSFIKQECQIVFYAFALFSELRVPQPGTGDAFKGILLLASRYYLAPRRVHPIAILKKKMSLQAFDL